MPAAVDGLMMGLGFTLVLVTLGAIRELLGSGTVMNNMHLLLGDAARHWTLHLPKGYRGFLLAILPPGAFLATGLLIAGKNLVDARLGQAHIKTSPVIASDLDSS